MRLFRNRIRFCLAFKRLTGIIKKRLHQRSNSMIQRKLGNSGLQASAIGLGTWAIGGGEWWGDSDEAKSIETIRAAVDAGITLIDTAPVYGFGNSETVVGKALKASATKSSFRPNAVSGGTTTAVPSPLNRRETPYANVSMLTPSNVRSS